MNHSLVALNLEKSYGRRKVVEDLSIRVAKGEIVGLLGPNGAGKTTAFSLIVGLVKPDGGRIYLNDEQITDLPMHLRARQGLGFLPQEPSIFRRMTVRQNLEAVLEMTSGRTGCGKTAGEYLADFGLESLADSPAVLLSGGERRRLEVARALTAGPEFLLLDEPFTGIDPKAVAELSRSIMELKNAGLGILLTDHSVREALTVIDRAYIIEGGRQLMEGTPEEILASDEVRKSYLGDEFRL